MLLVLLKKLQFTEIYLQTADMEKTACLSQCFEVYGLSVLKGSKIGNKSFTGTEINLIAIMLQEMHVTSQQKQPTNPGATRFRVVIPHLHLPGAK